MINHHVVTVQIHFHCNPEDVSNVFGELSEAIDCVSHDNSNVSITKIVQTSEPRSLASEPFCALCEERFIDHIPEPDEEMFL